jgi:hypothetical protein
VGEFPSRKDQFKKGGPGGPGRPRGRTLESRLRELLDKPTPVLDSKGKPILDSAGKQKTATPAQRLIQAGVAAALGGDFQFWRYIFDRIDGPIVQEFKGKLGADAADISDEDLAALAALAAKYESEKADASVNDGDQR